MMGADASIYQQFLRPPKSVADYTAEMDQKELAQLQMQGQRGQNALLDVTRQGQAQAAQSAMDDRNALQRVASSWAPTTTVAERAASLRSTGRPGLFTIADQLETQDGTRRNTEAGIKKTDAETAGKTAETAAKGFELRTAKYEKAIRDIAAFQSPQQALESLRMHAQSGDIDPQSAQMVAQTIPTDPAKFGAWQLGMLRRIMSAKDRMAFEVPDANTVATNATSRDNNRATVGASLANAAAVRDAAKEQAGATRDAARTQRDQATEMKMADDYRAQSKEFGQAMSAHKQLAATLGEATSSPAATLAAATKFMKILDPGSVVRESELGMALAASGVLDRAMNYVSTLQSGQKLTPTQAKDFKSISDKMFVAAQQVQQAIDADYKGKAKAYGLRPEMVTQDIGQNAKTVNFADLK